MGKDRKHRYRDVLGASYLIGVLGLVTLLLAVAIYAWVQWKAGNAITTTNSDWADYGSYLGGVVGPALSFLALLAVTNSIRLQIGGIRESRELGQQQIDLMSAEQTRDRDERKWDRLEKMAATTEGYIDRTLQGPVMGFENDVLEDLIEKWASRALSYYATGNPITLELVMECERIQSKDREVPKFVPLQARGYYLQISGDVLLHLALAIDSFWRCVRSMESLDLSIEKMDMQSYAHYRSERLKRLARKLYSLGIMKESMFFEINDAWKLREDSLGTKRLMVVDKE